MINLEVENICMLNFENEKSRSFCFTLFLNIASS